MLNNRYKQLVQTYIYSNTHIAIAAVCFLWGNALLLGFELDKYLSAYVFFSTLFTYQLSKYALFKNKVFESLDHDEQYNFTKNNLNYTFITMCLSALVIFFLFLKMPFQVQLWSIFVGFISIIYAIRIKIRGKEYKLRRVPFIKIFLITLVWASMGVIFNYTFWGHAIDWKVVVIQFLFLFSITLPFDIKDFETDTKTSVITIPTAFGKIISKWLTFLVTVFHLIAFYLVFKEVTLLFIVLYALLLSILVLLSFTKIEEMKKWQVMLVYDGSMIIFFLLTLIN